MHIYKPIIILSLATTVTGLNSSLTTSNPTGTVLRTSWIERENMTGTEDVMKKGSDPVLESRALERNVSKGRVVVMAGVVVIVGLL